MSSRIVRLALAVLAVLALAVGAAACGGSSSDDAPKISAKKLEAEVEQKLSDKFDTEVVAICDGGMTAKKGEEKRCIGSAASQDDLEQNIRVRVTDVKDGKANLNVVILQKVDLDKLETTIMDQATEQLGPDAVVECGDDYPDLEKGVEFDCSIDGSVDDSTKVTITVGKDNDIDSLDYQLS